MIQDGDNSQEKAAFNRMRGLSNEDARVCQKMK